jgi:hypothetical protein
VCNIATGYNCINLIESLIKFWSRFNISLSNIIEIQLGNIKFGISGSNLTIKNSTNFSLRQTLKSTLSAPTNNNDIVSKGYVDSLISDLPIYLSINDVYVQPQTGPIDLTVVEVPDPDGHKLITKNI